MTLHIGQSDLARIPLADADRVLGDIAAFGFQRVRFEVPFDRIFASPTPNWGTLGQLGALFVKHQLEALPVLGAHRPLGWAPGVGDYSRFCAYALTLLEFDVDQVELWNEPNLINFWPKADPSTFYAWAQSGYDAVKAVRPDTEVVLGGMAAAVDQFTGIWRFLIPLIGGAKSPDTFLAALRAKAGTKRFYDKVGYHPYSLDKDFKQVTPALEVMGISKIATLRMLAGEAPLVFTEVGFTGADNAVRTSLLTAQLALPAMVGIETYLYCWRDTGGERYGLVDTNNVPRDPYYSTVKAML